MLPVEQEEERMVDSYIDNFLYCGRGIIKDAKKHQKILKKEEKKLGVKYERRNMARSHC